MKDKHAITAQRVSIWNVKIDRLIKLQLPDMYLKEYQYAADRITLGSAIGNRFTLTIRDIGKTRKEIQSILLKFEGFSTSQGIPNYYGPQRFGEGNVDGGKAIIDGDLKQAVEVILQKVQEQYVRGGIESISKVFWYEKKMLRHLAKYPHDYAGALRRIPKRILQIYPHAYQSYLFNNKLRQAIVDNQIPQTITIEGFKVQKMPELNIHPITRASIIKPTNFHILRVRDDIATIRFTLGKGEYASTLLLNLMNNPQLK
jgi:tRNA pseudouridine13 synthase